MRFYIYLQPGAIDIQIAAVSQNKSSHASREPCCEGEHVNTSRAHNNIILQSLGFALHGAGKVAKRWCARKCSCNPGRARKQQEPHLANGSHCSYDG